MLTVAKKTVKEITAAELISDLKTSNYKKYENELQDLKITAMNDVQFSVILGLLFIKELSPSIKRLDVSFNQLKFLPKDMEKLTELESLSLRRNQLTTLDLFSCQVKKLLEGEEVMWKLTEPLITIWHCRKLRRVNIEHNQIKVVTEEVGQCVALEEFHVMGNPLKEFPYAIGHCTALKLCVESDVYPGSVSDQANQYKTRWQTLQKAYLETAEPVVEFFSRMPQIPEGLPQLIVSYMGFCAERFTPPAPKLLEEAVQASLTALFTAYKNKANPVSPQPERTYLFSAVL